MTFSRPKLTFKQRMKRRLETLGVFGIVASMVIGFFLAVGLIYVLIWGPIILFVKWIFGL